jgi:hypothetical protein
MQKKFKWFARIAGGLIFISYLIFFMGEGVPGSLDDTREGVVNLLPYGVLATAGYLLAWWKPFEGGLVLILAAILFFFFFLYRSDLYMAMVYGLPALFTGLSFVASTHKTLV